MTASEPVETEPDYRFTLANERTYLAWVRTSLALIASGVALMQFVPEFWIPGARHATSIVLVTTGGLLAMSAARRRRRVQDAMRRDDALPPSHMPTFLSVLLLGMVVLLVAMLINGQR
ncbi:MAG: YidH family protein [Mycobacterium sp.]